MTAVPGPEPGVQPPLHLHRWNDRAVVALALVAMASGFGQFGVVAALGSVAKGLGQVVEGKSLADQVGLSGTVLGVGLAVIRLSSLGSLPITGLADRFGRRIVLLVTVAAGLALTVAAAASPSFWWFVAIFALGRPLLSTTNALSQVAAAEQTGTSDRAKAVALIAAGYAVGAGLIAVVHSLASTALGFRGVFLLALVPLALVPLLRGWIEEPDRYAVMRAADDNPLPVWGAVAPAYRRRLAVVAGIGFAISFVTGPANSFIFLYAQNVLHQRGIVTAAMVVGASVTGLAGLLAGRWLADRVGRRPAGALGVVGVVAFSSVAYAGSAPALVAGYVLAVLAGAVFAPAIGAILNEEFPTSVRASVAGWFLAAGVLGAVAGLVVFGVVATADNRFGEAALFTFLPVALTVGLFWLLPETKGKEPEDLWPEP